MSECVCARAHRAGYIIVTVLCHLQKLFELEELTAPVDDSDGEKGVLYNMMLKCTK